MSASGCANGFASNAAGMVPKRRNWDMTEDCRVIYS